MREPAAARARHAALRGGSGAARRVLRVVRARVRLRAEARAPLHVRVRARRLGTQAQVPVARLLRSVHVLLPYPVDLRDVVSCALLCLRDEV